MDAQVGNPKWSGLGTGLVAVIGVAWFGEPIGVIRALALVMIVSGVVIVNLSR